MKNFNLFLLIIYNTVSLFAQTAYDSSDGEILKDIDGNIYATTTIGSQVWMAENLRVTKYNDGSTIPLIPTRLYWGSLTVGAYSWYKNDSASCAHDYGALYNWNAVNTGKLCPCGWHVPDREDWKYLIFINLDSVYYLSIAYSIDSLYLHDTLMFNKLLGLYRESGPVGFFPMAPKFKLSGEAYWKNNQSSHPARHIKYYAAPDFVFVTDKLSEQDVNETGFSALPGGYRNQIGGFGFIGKIGYWWSSSYSSSPERAYCFYLMDDDLDCHGEWIGKPHGLSVHCVKDQE